MMQTVSSLTTLINYSRQRVVFPVNLYSENETVAGISYLLHFLRPQSTYTSTIGYVSVRSTKLQRNKIKPLFSKL